MRGDRNRGLIEELQKSGRSSGVEKVGWERVTDILS
jgi:hypothetical protein